jgi:hypothetical protein
MPVLQTKSFPFSNLNEAGQPLSNAALYETLEPLLAGLQSLTEGLASGTRDGDLSAEEVHPGLLLLIGFLEITRELVVRWNADARAAFQGEEKRTR